jgi:hypothetical protein
MKKYIFVIIGAVVFLLLSITAVAETKILNQSIRYSDSSEKIEGFVKQGERVEIKISFLVSERRNVTFFTKLENPAFYLDEDKLTENSSLLLELSPGAHEIRVLGTVGFGKDNEEIILLGSDSMSKYILARIESPFILKEEAYVNYFVIGLLSVIVTGFAMFLLTKGKKIRAKSVTEKKAEKSRQKVRELLKVYFQNVAGILTIPQKQKAKKLVNEIDRVLQCQ